MRAREATLGANIAITYLALRVADGSKSVEGARNRFDSIIAEVYTYEADNATISRDPVTNHIRYSARFEDFSARLCGLLQILNEK